MKLQKENQKEMQNKTQKRAVLKMKNDIMFKAFFSRKENEEFLKDLLEAILEKEIRIKKVIHDARLEQLAKERKYGILDLDIELENGEILNIEMQLRNNKNIDERTVFYASKKIVEQMEPGMKYEEMKKVIVIAILDYILLDIPEYVTETVRVSTEHRDYEINNVIKYYYIELEKFRQQKPDMSKPINQWIAFLDMEGDELLEMAKRENKKIAKAIENYEVLTGDAEVKRLAEIRLMSELEEQSALATARAKGMEQGEKIGREEGEKIGREEGEKIGREEGEKIGREEGEKVGREKIVKELLNIDMPIEQIAKITKLSEDEIKKMQ